MTSAIKKLISEIEHERSWDWPPERPCHVGCLRCALEAAYKSDVLPLVEATRGVLSRVDYPHPTCGCCYCKLVAALEKFGKE